MMIKRTVLMIDDSQDDLEFYTELFKRSKSDTPYQLITADNVETALQCFADNDVDCVFVDLNMPEANGMDIITKLRESQKDKITPMAILTGLPDQSQQNAQKNVQHICKDSIISAKSLEDIIENMLKKQ